MAKKKPKRIAKHQTVPKTTNANNQQVDDVITAALNIAPPSVLMKVCRLCETKDGPFLNIFDADKVTAKKIEELMPFGLAENDDLPHKICFRCSAKVEELHEFIQKCIKTQENLRLALGKQGPLTMKSRTRVLWEQQLHKTKLSNDDICDVLIKRAMEGIPLNAPLEDVKEETPPPVTRKQKVEPPVVVKKESKDAASDVDDDDDDDDDYSLKQVKHSIEKSEDESTRRVSRSSCKASTESVPEAPEPLTNTNTRRVKTYPRAASLKSPPVEIKPPEPQPPKQSPPEVVESKKEVVVEKPKQVPPPEPKDTAPPFNIMDHVCIIKVNKVGTLFQCKLCVRNFLKKEIVMNHGCAKNHGPPKETNSANAPTPGPPKPSTVQYIKMDKNFKKPLAALVDKPVEKKLTETPPTKPAVAEPEVKLKPKPKVGPASRVKPKPEPSKEIPKEPTPPPKPVIPEVSNTPPSVSFPSTPSLNSRYKLVPGPNNTFQLVEETVAEEKPVETPAPKENPQPKGKKRRGNDLTLHKKVEVPIEKSSSPEVIDLDENESQKPEPYPVGLFQPVPHHSSINPPQPPVPFTTPAMKKQSYTIVQTGNPSKLLISTKPQPVEEPPKKKSKKKLEMKEKQPFTVTVEQNTPAKDPAFFTFVSLDPLLQPSYVLPTDNIIQESQISTSTTAKPAEKDKDKYNCNMCGETFSREKKLLTHIQSHYNQMDEEDEMRTSKPGPKRRTKK